MWGPAAALAAAVVCAAQGCTGTTETASTAKPAAQGVCPATPAETIGAACTVAGLRCGPLYDCGLLSVALLCQCTGGTFACTDGLGRPVESADALTCPATPVTSSCPATERAAQLATCTEQGLLCSYPSSCRSTLDPCQCAFGTTADGGFGLRFECRPVVCADAGSASGADSGRTDASTPDAGQDARPIVDGALDRSVDSAEADAADATGADAVGLPDAPSEATFPDDDASDAPSE